MLPSWSVVIEYRVIEPLVVVLSSEDKETPGLVPDIEIEFHEDELPLLKNILISLMVQPLSSEQDTVNVLLEESKLPEERL